MGKQKNTDEKAIRIDDCNDLEDWVKRIVANGERTLEKLKRLKSGADLLFEGKFGDLGTRWDAEKDGDLGTRWDAEKDGDLGEQLQQSMTMLTTFYAMKEYFVEQPLGAWQLSPGDKNGPDLYYEEKEGIICEVFAAKTPTQNGKLYKDLNALAKKGEDIKNRYVICCSPKDIPINRYVICCSPKDIPAKKFKLTIIDNLEIDENSNHRGELENVNCKTHTATWTWKGKKYSATIVHITPDTLCEWVREILG